MTDTKQNTAPVFVPCLYDGRQLCKLAACDTEEEAVAAVVAKLREELACDEESEPGETGVAYAYERVQRPDDPRNGVVVRWVLTETGSWDVNADGGIESAFVVKTF